MLTQFLAADAATPVASFDINTLIQLLLGPIGLTVGALYVVYQFASDKWMTAKRSDAQVAKLEASWREQVTKTEAIWRERFDEQKKDRDTAIDIAEKAVGGYTSVADAIKERNQLDALRLQALREGMPEPDPEIEALGAGIQARRRGPKGQGT